MRIIKIFMCILLFVSAGFSQKDTTKKVLGWKLSGIVGMNINQFSFTNWSQGGDNSLAWTALGTFGFHYFFDDWGIKNNLKLAYGRTKQGSTEVRTNDNEIFLENVLQHHFGWEIDPFFSSTVRSSLSDGTDYKVTPYKKIAGFFDPGYLTQSLGFSYTKCTVINTRLGFAFQEIFTNKYRQYSDDPSTSEKEAFKLETGIESVSELKCPLDDNVLFTSKLRLFGKFENFSVWDVRWENLLTAKINKYFNVNCNVLALYEKNQSLRTQLKEALQLGITYTLL